MAGEYLRHAHKAGDLGGHAHVAEEALVRAPEGAPEQAPPPSRLLVAAAHLFRHHSAFSASRKCVHLNESKSTQQCIDSRFQHHACVCISIVWSQNSHHINS